MNKIRFISICLLLGLLSLSLGAVDQPPKGIFAPYVTNLKAESRGPHIFLTWKDAPHLQNPRYHIYELDRPAEKESFSHAREIAVLSQGEEHYLHTPSSKQAHYFLVLAEEFEKLYDIFIPYRNMTMSPLAAGMAKQPWQRAESRKQERIQAAEASVRSIPPGIPKPAQVVQKSKPQEEDPSGKKKSINQPLPLYQPLVDIERGTPLPSPELPEIHKLSPETLQALGELNYGKQVNIPLWKQPVTLQPSRARGLDWAQDFIKTEDWQGLLKKIKEQMQKKQDSETLACLHFYKGEALYFLGDLNYSFLEFLAARKSLKESGSWMYSIFKQKRRQAASQEAP